MRLKKPVPALIDQVRITRDGNDAIIEYADPEISGTRLTIGSQIETMTDRDICRHIQRRHGGSGATPARLE